MSSSDEGGSSTSAHQKKYRGIRRRKWGKWVSEIRVPGSSERLWLGTYTTPEAAAVAHDIAYYCLREPLSSLNKLNFPLMLPANVERGMSPRSVQKVASDAGMAIDAKLVTSYPTGKGGQQEMNGHVCQSVDNNGQSEDLSISVEDYLY